MSRMLAMTLLLALAVPTLAAAQQNNEHRVGGARPGPARAVVPVRPGPRPFVEPHGPGPAFRGPPPGGPRPGGGAAQLMFRGHPINRMHVAPFGYPAGYAYRRWAVGAALPALFLAPAYYYTEWAGLGLSAPPPGFQWVRYGPDLLLVNDSTGQVVDAAYGVFY